MNIHFLIASLVAFYDRFYVANSLIDQKNCNCIPLKMCHSNNELFKSENISILCGYVLNEPAICCNTDETIIENMLPKNNSDLHSANKLIQNYNNLSQLLMHFEEPNTYKNSPMIISEEFDRIPNVTNKKIQSYSQAIKQINKFEKKYKLQHLNPSNCGIFIGTRIIGGKDAEDGQFPWIARIAYRNKTSGKHSFRCAGSVIIEKYIITAAHCLTNLVDDLEISFVRVGELNLNKNIACPNNSIGCKIPKDYEIEDIVIHSNYNNPKYANDIAIIHLKMMKNSKLISICLPIQHELNSSEYFEKYDNGIVVGWGINQKNQLKLSPTLKWIQLPIINQNECALLYAEYSANLKYTIKIDSMHLCIQGHENMDACQGDSGGPLINPDKKNSRYILHGLVSFGPRTCGINNLPGVYTRVSSYIDWILESLNFT